MWIYKISMGKRKIHISLLLICRALFYLSELKNEKDAVELCNMLLDANANTNIQNRNGETALIRACQKQKWDLVQ
jgi:ankyrin repeat protein